MKKKFEFEFEDCSSENTIKFDFDDEMDEDMKVVIENNTSVIYANKDAYLVLAKALIKMALCEYSPGFHFHLRQNFDADQEDAIRFHLID
ncbi:MAG: hypothetical protein GDA44_09765 [Prochloron sp. SP5CPC1]|nr:hypothetical protein [Candidatus Paraprochloron terpiosi SP5CPC1]